MPKSDAADSAVAETKIHSADVIPFPHRTAAEKVIPTKAAGPDVTPDVRLARALESLQEALVQHRAATARWREVLGELKTTVNGLHGSLLRYQTNLKTLNTSVTGLNAQATALADWADGVSKTKH